MHGKGRHVKTGTMLGDERLRRGRARIASTGCRCFSHDVSAATRKGLG